MARQKHGTTTAESGDVTITILHVSDMQFGHNHRFGRLGLGGDDENFDTLLKRLTDDLEKLRDEQGLKPDLMTLTGDLAEWGFRKEYDDVFLFCVGVQEHLKLGRDRILVIPGNHDINRKLCEAYFAEREGNGEKPVAPYWPKWKPYVEFFGKLYKDVERYEFKETAPYTWFELPELKVVVAGLNSTMRESHKEKDPKEPASIFGHYGYVGEAQLEWFKKKLDEAEKKGWLRIGLVHHNALRGAEADDENLRDAPMLKDRIGSKLNLLLHGHTHNGILGWLDRDLPVLSTGSAAVKAEQRPEEIPNQYQIIQVHRDGFITWARQYIPARRTWIADPRASRDGNNWHHEQRLDLPNTHETFGAREPGVRGQRSQQANVHLLSGWEKSPVTPAQKTDKAPSRSRPSEEGSGENDASFPMTPPAPVKVFISYSQDSESHKSEVLALVVRLRHDGVDAQSDHAQSAPPEGWPLWMERQIEAADFVLVVCTERYHRRWQGLDLPPKGRGATWESLLSRQELYDDAPNNNKFIPVLFDGATADDVPKPLRPYTRYRFPTDYTDILRHVTNQPSIVLPPVGPLRVLPPTIAPAIAPSTAPEPSTGQSAPKSPAKPPGRIKIDQAIAKFRAKYGSLPLIVDLQDGVHDRTTRKRLPEVIISLSDMLEDDTFLLDFRGIPRTSWGIVRHISYGAVEEAYVGTSAEGEPAIGLRLSVRLIVQRNNGRTEIDLERY